MALYLADLTETWSLEARGQLLSALVKKLCEGNYGYPPIPLTEPEAAALARWRYPNAYRASFFGTPGVSADADASIRAAERSTKEQLGGYRIDKALLKKMLRHSMVARFGEPSEGQYIRQTEELKVRTEFDFGVRSGQFEYIQWVETRDGKRLLRHGGILALLGWPQTRWGRLTSEDIPATASLVARLCEEFVDAVPEMWRGSGLADEPNVSR